MDELKKKIDENGDDFSKAYIFEKKKELALELLKLLGISSFNEQKYITYSDLQSPLVLKKFKMMFPALKTVFKVSKIRALNINSWNKCKHPGVNLLRQILKDIGYKLHLINEYQGNRHGKKTYNTKYIIIPYSPDSPYTPKTIPLNYVSSKPFSLMDSKEFEELKSVAKNIKVFFDEDLDNPMNFGEESDEDNDDNSFNNSKEN
jgi:hypothetical protein